MIALWAALALAHPLSPSALTVEGAELTWRTPLVGPRGQVPRVVLPCEAPAPEVSVDDQALEQRWTVPCAIDRLEVQGLTGTDVLVTVDGARSLLTPESPVWTRRREGLTGFVRTGALHLATGLDHVLLVGCLPLLTRGRRLLVAVSAFTLGHSLSMALAVGLGLSLGPGVEVFIALTLLGAAWESAVGAKPRHPGWQGLLVGIVHGLGFAGGLQAHGWQGADLIRALLGFNGGLELAQLGVLALWVPLVRRFGWLGTLWAYGAGALAVRLLWLS